MSVPSATGHPTCVAIPAGSFRMGCDRGRDEERPVHEVWVDAFEIAACQVTVGEFRRFLDATGAAPPPYWGQPDFGNPEQPVVAVSWFEAVSYCEWLSAKTGQHYRLPTEAEWERAARGGVQDALYTWGDDPPESAREYQRWRGAITGPLPVGASSPTGWGLFDFGDNVHEWCSDWFDKAYYSHSPVRNPQGPEAGQRRASRGGSWRHQIKVSRCAARASIPPEFHYTDYGFRIARDSASTPCVARQAT